MKKIFPAGRILYTCLLFAAVFLWWLPSVVAAQVSILRSTNVEDVFRLEAAATVQQTCSYFKENGQYDFAEPITILLVNGEQEYINANIKFDHVSETEALRRAKTTVAWVQGNMIISNVGGQPTQRQRAFTIAHELAHKYQGQMAGKNAFAVLWMTEGSADYWAAKIVDHMGFASLSWYRHNWEAGLRTYHDHIPELASLERAADWYKALDTYGSPVTYRTADLAIFRLVDLQGEEVLFAYFRGNGGGKTAAEAFAAACGQSFAEFYDSQERNAA